MSPDALALISLVGALVCGALSLALARSGRVALACAAALGAAALLRMSAGADYFLHSWDERYHALVAKHLADHPLLPTLYERPVLPYDYHQWFANHVWLHKPPFALWLMALSIELLGANEWAVRLPSLLLSTASVGLTYGIGRRIFDPGVALFAAFFHAVHHLSITLASGRTNTDHVDTAFLFLFELGVFVALRCSPRWRAPAVGLVLGLALLTKSLVALLLVPLFLAWRWAEGEQGGGSRGGLLKDGSIALVLGLLVWAPWQAYVALAFPQETAWETTYTLAHVLEPLEGHGGGLLFHVRLMPGLFGELVYLPLAWFLWRAFRRRDRRDVVLALWLVVPYAAFSLVATKMPAYVMVSAPAVFLICSEWCSRLWAARGGPSRAPALAALALTLILPVRQCLDALAIFRPYDRDPAWARDLRALGHRWPGEKVVIFNCPRPVETMFYAPFWAYSSLPPPSVLKELSTKGYRVAVYDGPGLSAELRDSPTVSLLQPR